MGKNIKAASFINYSIAFLAGALISIMVVCNTELGLKTSNNISITMNQLVGIIALTIVMVCTKGNKSINPDRKPAPLWRWFGGLFGLAILTINYFAVSRAGTTIAMAAAVLGQCIMGLVFDLTGFMGMEKRAISKKKLIALAISFIGILIMLFFSGDKNLFDILFYAFLSIIAGALTMTQMVYNSGFAKLKGPLFSARQNVISGLAGITLFIILFNFHGAIDALHGLKELTLFQIASGGILGTAVVVCANVVIPKIPGAVSSILMSAGQILTAVLLDYFMYSVFEPSLIIGSLLMIVGIALSE